jgi:hypothetical protein
LLSAVLLAFPLLAAAPTPAPNFLPRPTIVVYPLTVNGSSVGKDAGSKLAIMLATQMADGGGVIVKPATPGTERTDYLTSARAQGADYYVAGYVTPIGDSVSVVEQVVSTETGIVVFSNTAQLQTYAEAAGQGDLIRIAILRHSGRNFEAFDAPPQQAQKTPAPVASSAPQANLSGLFKHRKKAAAPSPTPAPTVAATEAPLVALAASGPTYGIVVVGGPAALDEREFAEATLTTVLEQQKLAVTTGVAVPDLCEKGATAVLSGTLWTRPAAGKNADQKVATFQLQAVDCKGHLAFDKRFVSASGTDVQALVEHTVTEATTAYLHTPAASAVTHK